ncbi:MAG: hypothetical protein KZQ58_12075, partial [gamma proteobacterium symbiont of Bathyaustriella thionipta]|nr:hypothetical protein [gamma proteobacterium symbiont of Bathyaustriella thionipta]
MALCVLLVDNLQNETRATEDSSLNPSQSRKDKIRQNPAGRKTPPISALSERQLVAVTALLSILISLWLLYSGDIISRDAVGYLADAQNIQAHGYRAALQAYGGPLYAILISGVHSISRLSLQDSAHLLSILFEALICISFIKLYALIKTEEGRLWVAAFFILSFPIFNEYRAEILRGSGFWLFGLLAVYQFIRDYQKPHGIHALAWQIFIFTALLFRLEGVVLALLAPFFYIFATDLSLPQRLIKILRLNSLFILTAIVLLLAWSLSDEVRVLLQNSLPKQVIYLQPFALWSDFISASERLKEFLITPMAQPCSTTAEALEVYVVQHKQALGS